MNAHSSEDLFRTSDECEEWAFTLTPMNVGAEWSKSPLRDDVVQGYLAHKKTPTPLGPPRTLGIALR